jgi:hypothetical protein
VTDVLADCRRDGIFSAGTVTKLGFLLQRMSIYDTGKSLEIISDISE